MIHYLIADMVREVENCRHEAANAERTTAAEYYTGRADGIIYAIHRLAELPPTEPKESPRSECG